VRRSVVALLHAGYWAAYLLLLAVVLAVLRLQVDAAGPFLSPRLAARLGVLAVLPNAAAFYLSYLVLFPRFLARRRIAALVAAATAATLGCAGLGVLGTCLASGPGQAVCASRVELAGVMALLAPVAAAHALMALGMRGFVGWYGDLRIKEELARRTHEVESALVRSKLDPHFLFNTLNNLDVLIERDPAAASAYLHKLCDLMRFVLYEARAETIPLAAELAYIETYLELERVRSANPRHVVYTSSGDPDGLSIAPMVFIPFLENAFKHAASSRAGTDIAVEVRIEGRRVHFVCANRHRGAAGPAAEPGGLGNPLTARRLELLYPGRHTLEVADDGGTYTVRLCVELE
jgi:two-component system, LytTR family, sensor kinase